MITGRPTLTDIPQARQETARQAAPVAPVVEAPRPPENPNEQLQAGVTNVRHLMEERATRAHRTYFEKNQAKEALAREGREKQITDESSFQQKMEFAQNEEDEATMQIEANKKAQEELRRIDTYSREQERIERERRPLAQEVDDARRAVAWAASKNRRAETIADLEEYQREAERRLSDYENQNIPAELRGSAPLPLEAQNSEISQVYAQQVSPHMGHLREEMNRIRGAETADTTPTTEPGIVIEPETTTADQPHIISGAELGLQDREQHQNLVQTIVMAVRAIRTNPTGPNVANQINRIITRIAPEWMERNEAVLRQVDEQVRQETATPSAQPATETRHQEISNVDFRNALLRMHDVYNIGVENFTDLSAIQDAFSDADTVIDYIDHLNERARQSDSIENAREMAVELKRRLLNNLPSRPH